MRIAMVAAEFTGDEANGLRRAMATFRHMGTINTYEDMMVGRMIARGYDPQFAKSCFEQIRGFGEYGFPESHAAAFAQLVYVSAWIKCFYPEVFCAALLNSQPMGFYAPAQILRDAEDHGVTLREVDVNASDWDSALDETQETGRLHARHAEMAADIYGRRALRLGFREAKGLAEEDMLLLVARRGGGYDSVRDLWLRTGLSLAVLETLASADAFSSLGLTRREALWAVAGLNRAGDKDDLPLLRALAFTPIEADAALPPMPPGEAVMEDYRALSHSLKGHPVAFLRKGLTQKGIVSCAEFLRVKGPLRPRLTVAGLVLMRQRPGTAKGTIFMTIEDETGSANVIVWPKIFERQRAEVLGARLVAVQGEAQEESGVLHLIARKVEDITPALRLIERARAATPRARDFH